MSAARNGRKRPSPPDSPDLRVVVVGRSTLESRLRRDRGIELVRARTAVDAVGEVVDPIDDESPTRTAVAIAPGALAPEEERAFADAMRTLKSPPRLLRVTDPRAGAGRPAPFDGCVRADADAKDFRAALDAAPEQPAKPAFKPVHVQPPRPSVTARPPGETAIINTAITGGDVLGACLEAIRAELRHTDVSFTPAAAGGATDDAPAGAPVMRRERLFGHLACPGAERAALEAQADRLAHWLALAEQQKQLRTAAFMDDLTGAWNRRYFWRFLPSAIEHARRRRRDVTLMLFDIDDFKIYNDRFGHSAGDEILREAVRLLQSVIRPTDRVCRVGGDEFAVVFDDPRGPRAAQTTHHPTSISDIASRFQRQICEQRFPKLGSDARSTLTISGGMATFPWDGACAQSLLERADELLLESKRLGKNIITLGPGAERVCSIQFGDADGPGASKTAESTEE